MADTILFFVIIIISFFFCLFIWSAIIPIIESKKIVAKELENKILFTNKFSEFISKLSACITLFVRIILGIIFYHFWVWILLFLIYFLRNDFFITLVNYWWIWTPIVIFRSLFWALRTMLWDYAFETQNKINKFVNNLVLNKRLEGENILPSVKEAVNNEINKISNIIIERNKNSVKFLNVEKVLPFNDFFNEYDFAIKLGFNKLYEEVENLELISFRHRLIPYPYEFLEYKYQAKSYHVYSPMEEELDSERYLIEKFKHYRIKISKELIQWLKKKKKGNTFTFKAKNFAKILSKLKMEKDYIFEEGSRNCHERIEIIESMEKMLYEQLPDNFYETKKELEKLYLFFYALKLPGLIDEGNFDVEKSLDSYALRNDINYEYIKCYPYLKVSQIFNEIYETMISTQFMYLNPNRLLEHREEDALSTKKLKYKFELLIYYLLTGR